MSEILEKKPVENKTKPSCLWNVIMLNDDYTSFEFVTYCLINIFNKTEEAAAAIALHIHQTGKGIVGTYTKDLAQTKQVQAISLAKDEGYPLLIKLEPQT